MAMRNAYILVLKSQGKGLVRSDWYRWKGNIEVGLRDVMSEGVDWLELIQDRVQLQSSSSSFFFFLNPILSLQVVCKQKSFRTLNY
jgi:hypothetical protein